MRRTLGLVLATGVTTALLSMGCSDDGASGGGNTPPGADAGPDVDDPGQDAQPDAEPDATPDAEPDAEPEPKAAVGDGCWVDDDCEGEAICWSFDAGQFPAGMCIIEGCTASSCPDGSGCFEFTDGVSRCLATCATNDECRVDEGYICDQDSVCWPGTGTVPPGGSCTDHAQCQGGDDAYCFDSDGYVGNYCIIVYCTEGSCPDGSECRGLFSDGTSTISACVPACADGNDCREGYQCVEAPGEETDQVCLPGCNGDTECPGAYWCSDNECVNWCTPGSCPSGEICDGKVCIPEPCTPGSCEPGDICYEGGCVPDHGDGPGQDTVDCPNLPEIFCDPAVEDCAELIQFDPTDGDGYYDYPANGETASNQYRSWLRRDFTYLVKYAAAYVACKAKDWTFGNGGDIGFIDMSEEDGSIPGTSDGYPGHPAGTHTNGWNIDIAYYQVNTPDNRGREICNHYLGGEEAYRCVETPHLLDPWRTALFIGAFHAHPNLRVIGFDGKAAPMIEMAYDKLCANGWLPSNACTARKYSYATVEDGSGWYTFHHHHIHVDFHGTNSRSMSSNEHPLSIIPGGNSEVIKEFYRQQQAPTLLSLPR